MAMGPVDNNAGMANLADRIQALESLQKLKCNSHDILLCKCHPSARGNLDTSMRKLDTVHLMNIFHFIPALRCSLSESRLLSANLCTITKNFI